MKQYKTSRSYIVGVIVETSQDIDFSIEDHGIDGWVKDAEETLREFFKFDQLTSQHVLSASRKIRRKREEKFFNESFFHQPTSVSLSS